MVDPVVLLERNPLVFLAPRMIRRDRRASHARAVQSIGRRPPKTLGYFAEFPYYAHMKIKRPTIIDDISDLANTPEEVEQASEKDLWLSRLVPDFN